MNCYAEEKQCDWDCVQLKQMFDTVDESKNTATFVFEHNDNDVWCECEQQKLATLFETNILPKKKM